MEIRPSSCADYYHAIECMICGEPTRLAQISHSHYQYAICDNCKKAVLYIRKQINDKEKKND